MAFKEEDINELIKKYLEEHSITLSNLSNIDTSIDGEIWVFGTRTIKGEDGQDDTHESVKINISDLKGQSGANSAGVSVYRKLDEQPAKPIGDALPPDDWQMEMGTEDGIWWKSTATFTVDIEGKYDKMIGSWSIPIRATVRDGNTAITERRYCSSESSTKITIKGVRIRPWVKEEFDWNNPKSPGNWWKKKRQLASAPVVSSTYINDPTNPAQYNTDAEPPIYLWETTATILNGIDVIEEWSDPIMISGYGGKTPETPGTPELTPVFNLSFSNNLMLCDPDTFEAISGQTINITAKLQNYKDLSSDDVEFKMIPYGSDGRPIEDGHGVLFTNLSEDDANIANDVPKAYTATTTLKSGQWDKAYVKVEITCTIKGKSATGTINRHVIYEGAKGIVSYLAPESYNLTLTDAEEDGVMTEDIINFRGQLHLIEGDEFIIGDGKTSNAVEFEFGSKYDTDSFRIAIVEKGEWKFSGSGSHESEDPSEDETDGTFKIISYPPGVDNMRITIWAKYKGTRRASTFSVYKFIKGDEDNPEPGENTRTDESIFTLTMGHYPTIKVDPEFLMSDIYQAKDFIPEGESAIGGVEYTPEYIKWVSSPPNYDNVYTHVFRSDRTKTNGVWGSFCDPYIWVYSPKLPELPLEPELKVFLENNRHIFNRNVDFNNNIANVIIKASRGIVPVKATEIIVGEPDDELRPYHDIFRYSINTDIQVITFILNETVDDYKEGIIPITVIVEGQEWYLNFEYSVIPKDKDFDIQLSFNSKIITRDRTDIDKEIKESSIPSTITVSSYHVNVDNLKWSFKVDGVGELTNEAPVGVVINDDKLIITTKKIKASETLLVRLSGTGDNRELYDEETIHILYHGETGIPGKTPFTKKWEVGYPHRNNPRFIDYIYYREPNAEMDGDDLNRPIRSGWFKLTDDFESLDESGSYAAPESPYADNDTDGTIFRRDNGKIIYEKIDYLGTKAFELIIAENANLAGFVFRHNRLYSQDMQIVDGELTANLMLSGGDGVIKARGAEIEGKITATSGKIGHFTLNQMHLIGHEGVDKETGVLTGVTLGLNADQGLNKDNIAFWAGGSLSEVYDYSVNRPQGEDQEGKKPIAYIRHDGKALFSDADIQGKITASSGTIGGFTVGNNYLRGYNEQKKPTVGLNANASKTSDIAFWAGNVLEGKDPNDEQDLDIRAIIRHDGSSKFSNAVIEGDITATTGTIGGFTVDDNYLKGYEGYGEFSDKNVTVGLNAKAGVGIQNIAFWSGGTLGEAFSAKDKMFDTELPKMAYITHKGESFFSDATIVGDVTATSGKIGGFRIDSSYLKAYSKVDKGEYDEADVTMGLNADPGVNKDNIALWAGGSINGSPKAIIKHDGKAIFTDAEIIGTVNATNGSFRGSIESNAVGDKVVIDTKANSGTITGIDSTGNEIFRLGFDNARRGGWGNSASFSLYARDENDPASKFIHTGWSYGGLTMSNSRGSEEQLFTYIGLGNITVSKDIDRTTIGFSAEPGYVGNPDILRVSMKGLPTSPANIRIGDLWSDKGTIKIK